MKPHSRKVRKALIQFLTDVTKESAQWTLLTTGELWVCAHLEALEHPELEEKLDALLKEAQ